MLLERLCKAIISAEYQICLGCGRPIHPRGDRPTCNDCPAGTGDCLDSDELHTAIHAIMKKYHSDVKRVARECPDLYDPDFGDDEPCVCGHVYYRHFDWAEDYSPVGCKYQFDCGCTGFELAEDSK